MDRELLNQLYRYCYSLVGNESDAYDLLHSAIEKYLRISPNTVQNKKAYLKKIIKNQFIDQFRKQRNINEEPFDEAVTYIDVDIESFENIQASRIELENIWSLLSADEREILYLWAVEGYSMTELSGYLQIPRGTLLSKVHRLRKRLEQHLESQCMEGAS